MQRRVAAGNRFGIPAIAHEECLNGFMTWGATIFPSPPAWGATFDPGLVEEMAAAIGSAMRASGVHQGLAPVLDVVRDPRWGRTEECAGVDMELPTVRCYGAPLIEEVRRGAVPEELLDRAAARVLVSRPTAAGTGRRTPRVRGIGSRWATPSTATS
ncbi:glycoside hydrolase family 3 N-terminal domain-containing protein [Actinomadura physcomitrii]|uniref:glycoside hydrolase family 3 N-terminal domain-containing protein n=1 Tax=Actinomadura physcomitrii TaxID=2650748 RepID=UPI002E26B8BF